MKKQTKKKGISLYILMLILTVFITLILSPLLLSNLKFGLDLQGGFEVLYEVSSVTDEKLTKDMMESTYKTIARRIDEYGVSEPMIQIEGNNRIRVQLAGVKNAEEARANLSQVASLTFRDTNDNLLMTSDVIKSAAVGKDEKGMPAVSLKVKDKSKFYEVTKKISKQDNNIIVIWIDFEEGKDSYKELRETCGLEGSRCLSAASVSQAFASDVIIQGNFKQEEVRSLVSNINSGSLPTKVTEISSKTVSASFGENSLNKTALAGLLGLIVVMIFMIVIYRFAGLIASIGLLLYSFVSFFIFWLIGGVLTLPGIAAMILGIGMAVDANVINFARIKDELREGKDLKRAYKEGCKNSLLTVLDANITTLIAAIILFIFGESSVKGFATMLMISIFTTLFVMVFLVRFITTKIVNTGKLKEKTNFFIGKQREFKLLNKINYEKGKTVFLLIPVILIFVGAIFFFKDGLNLGIEFKGGTSITLQTEKEVLKDKIKEEIDTLGFHFESYSKENADTYTIIIDNSLEEQDVLKTVKYFEDTYEANVDVGVVSNQVKKDLVKNAIYSLILAILGIVIYISLRFTFSYAISGIIALVHDALVVLFIFSIFKLEVSTIFIAAILSILGYSINDTIVLFDRIRENKKKIYNNTLKKKEELKDLINTSIKTTLKRNIFTSITTILPVISLLVFGSSEIFEFNIAMLIGLIAGSYSSLFVSTFIYYFLEVRNVGKIRKKKWWEDEVEEKKRKGINS